MQIIIYSREVCPYCTKAKSLLERKLKPLGLSFTEIKISDDDTKNEMIKKSGGRMTVPQIFINDIHIGGCDDLYALDKEGGLDTLLNTDPS